MKIAIVSSIFIPDMGYLEEGLTRVLASMGHDVHVSTSFHYPVNFKGKDRTPLPENQKVEVGKSRLTYSIVRLKAVIKLRSNIICAGLSQSIVTLNPDLVILIGVSDFFPVFLINKSFSRRFKIYAFIGQNHDMDHWRNTNSFPKRMYSYFVNRIVKGFIYRISIRYLTRIIFYTPDTEGIITKLLPSGLLPALNEKKINIPLGFNSEDFYFLPESRNLIRKQLNIDAKQVVFITITRVDKSKRIIEIINSLFLISKLDVIYIIIGFINNSDKTEIENIIQINKLQNNVLCFPFLPNSDLIDYLSAADIGIWLKSSASIQQAMGSGLPVILPKNNTTSMLLEEGRNGYYIKDNLNETIKHALSLYSYSIEKRIEIENNNKDQFSYQSILKEILKNNY